MTSSTPDARAATTSRGCVSLVSSAGPNAARSRPAFESSSSSARMPGVDVRGGVVGSVSSRAVNGRVLTRR